MRNGMIGQIELAQSVAGEVDRQQERENRYLRLRERTRDQLDMLFTVGSLEEFIEAEAALRPLVVRAVSRPPA